MAKKRIIARLDIKKEHLIKGVHMEGWRKVGAPAEFAELYSEGGADELIYIDVVASLYGRNGLIDLVKTTARNVFVPLCVGGGIQSIEDADRLFRAGADKVAVNTAAIANPKLLVDLSEHFGAQAVVLSIEAKKQPHGSWECFTENGRERTGVDVVTWASKAREMGAGEILLTSVDQDGTKRGFDLALISAVTQASDLPVIASGGAGSSAHVLAAFERAQCDAVALASVLHYEDFSLGEIRHDLLQAGQLIREKVR